MTPREIPSFDALADREAALIRRIVALPARTPSGLMVKAQGALLRPEVRGYDCATALALSAAQDLHRLAGGPGPSFSAEAVRSGLPPPDAVLAALISDPTMSKGQIMDNLFGADGRRPVRGRDVVYGSTIGLLAELGAGAVGGGIALLVGRPDLPRPFPAALVLIGLGAIALAVAYLRRVTRP